MKIIYQGKEVELDDELEKGEKELDIFEPNNHLEDTIELTKEISELNKKEELLEKTGEFNYEQYQ